MSENSNKNILEALLAPPQEVQKEVFMKRFGINFVIRSLTADETTKITQRATRLTGKNKEFFDKDLFNYLTIAEACVVPNWKDKELQSALGVYDEVEAIKKRLLFGEIVDLINEIAELNGYDKSDDELIDEVKN